MLRAAAPEWTAAPEVADDAFFVTDDMPRGAAIFVEHLHLRHGDSLAEVTLVGRVGPDAAHDLLVRVGIDVLASLGGASPT